MALSAKARRNQRYHDNREERDRVNATRYRLMNEGKHCAICRHFRGIDVECVPMESPPHANHICAEFEDK